MSYQNVDGEKFVPELSDTQEDGITDLIRYWPTWSDAQRRQIMRIVILIAGLAIGWAAL